MYWALPLADGFDLTSDAITPATMSSMKVKSLDSSVSFGPCAGQLAMGQLRRVHQVRKPHLSTLSVLIRARSALLRYYCTYAAA